MTDLFTVRAGREGDRDLVLASWVESNRWSPLGRDAGEQLHRREHRRIAEGLLDRSRLTVAHATDDEDALLGWALWFVEGQAAPVTLHYVYVKKGARRLGIARALLQDIVGSPVEYTHRPVVRGALPIPSSWTYNPYRIWRRP